MMSNEIDHALTDFVRLSRDLSVEPNSDWRRRIEERGGQLVKELPPEYHEFIKTLCWEALERPPATLARPVPGPAEPVVIPDEDDIPEALVESSGLPEPAMNPTGLSSSLPVRNQTKATAPHVNLFTEHNGLIHGGVVRIGSAKLICRAFRFFERRYTTSRSARQTDVVAGVCEHYNASGALVQRWTTAKRLPHMYQSTGVPLPTYACRYTAAASLVNGFYIGNGHPYQIRVSIKHHKRQIVIDAPENANPDPNFYRSGYGAFFAPSALSPTPETSVENPFFSILPTGSSGYVVSTPYLSIFSPNPEMPTVIVSMIGAYREGEFVEFADHGIVWATRLSNFQREARWDVRSFKLE